VNVRGEAQSSDQLRKAIYSPRGIPAVRLGRRLWRQVISADGVALSGRFARGAPMNDRASVQHATLPKPLTIGEWRKNRRADRRASETFSLECAGLNYVASLSRFADGRLQFVDVDVIRIAFCWGIRGNASGPSGGALDMLAASP
jgi:hypothetical protein